MGKGSSRRPSIIKKDEFNSNWDRTFANKPTLPIITPANPNHQSILMVRYDKAGHLVPLNTGLC